ncbi:MULTISPECIES: M23 family metallopeptidase [unclassified Helicobacter]|uniref:M23 family metallopeptidase n=1 Tax=unclassified Helicobacter TaxID=2593540 RepID=UPI000CF1C4D1|nr:MULTISPECIES: M23 family metallopeptidase [unclassified Helicobacter]
MRLKFFFQLVVVIGVGFLGYYVYHSKFFEKDSPVVTLMAQIGTTEREIEPGEAFWNFNRNIAIYMSDESGIRSYRIVARDAEGQVLIDKQEAIIKRPKSIKVSLPKPNIVLKDDDRIFYEIIVNDWSNANFFSGNTTKLKFNFTIDTEAPVVRMIANSYKISYGGSALLIFKINDKSTQEVIVTNGTDEFKAYPFLKEGYYAVLIAWPIKNKVFGGTITAVDKAWNTKRVAIPIIKDSSVRYRFSDIKINDQFLSTKLDSLIEIIGERSPNSFDNPLEKFKYINELVRNKDENIIFGITNNLSYENYLKPINFNVFLPLKKSQVVGSFGDHRTYFYKDRKFSKSLHLGLDIANFKHAPVVSTNAGKIVFSGLLGVYGNTVIIDHGIGLASLYSHLSSFEYGNGAEIVSHTQIGNTGQTGWAFGDHLHLGILVQGHPVRVVEWMDSKWIKNNITDVFLKAQSIIEVQK